MTNYPPTPELDKMLAVKDKSQVIGEFLDWLRNEGVLLTTCHSHTAECEDDEGRICGLNDYEHEELTLSIEQLLAKYFEINLRTIERERAMLLEHTRKGQS